MKIGTFVGKEFVLPTSEEQDYVENIINKVMNNSFSNPHYKIEKRVSDFTKSVIFDVVGQFDKTEYRDREGNTYLPTHIRVSFHKNNGYDEKVYGKPWELRERGITPPYDITSFSCSVDFFGHFRAYRRRTTDTFVGITPTNYSYGTELTDLDCEMGLRNISNYFYHSSINHGTPLKY